ncbi:MAG: maleylpyruvate isomerase family mycothiol-dependent enzyme [Pseudonocardiaceae bacterium]
MLADFLETLEPADWEVRSLCTNWTVRDVVAHVAWGPTQAPMERMVVFGQGRVPDLPRQRRARQALGEVDAGADGRPPAGDRGDRHRPVGITDAHVLVHIVCHDLDIRRPLGRRRSTSGSRRPRSCREIESPRRAA